jgi:hypothetical protein
MKMKNPIQEFAALVVLSVALLGTGSARANTCGASAFGNALAKEGVWRQAKTQPSQKGEFAATSAAREKLLADREAYMVDFILNYQGHYGKGDIPPMEIVPAEGSKFDYVTKSDGDNGIITRIKVSNIGSTGVLKATLLLPVSGHNGNANARAWAKTDTYNVWFDQDTRPMGTGSYSWNRTAAEKVVFGHSKSLDMVTFQEVEVPLKKGEGSTIVYARDNSAGPGGYVEGRVILLVWDGT